MSPAIRLTDKDGAAGTAMKRIRSESLAIAVRLSWACVRSPCGAQQAQGKQKGRGFPHHEALGFGDR